MADQGAKAWARAALTEGGVALWPRHLYLELVHNRGVALGWLDQHPAVSTLLTLGLMVALTSWWARSTPRRLPSALALGAVLGGASSNLFDRLVRSDAVVDMIVVIFAPGRRFPAFNLADAAVSIGLVGLAMAMMGAMIRATSPAPHHSRGGDRGERRPGAGD